MDTRRKLLRNRLRIAASTAFVMFLPLHFNESWESSFLSSLALQTYIFILCAWGLVIAIAIVTCLFDACELADLRDKRVAQEKILQE